MQACFASTAFISPYNRSVVAQPKTYSFPVPRSAPFEALQPLILEDAVGETPNKLRQLEKKLKETYGDEGTIAPLKLAEFYTYTEEIANHFDLVEVVEAIGKGGFGCVFKAVDQYGQVFALKTVSPRYDDAVYQRHVYHRRILGEVTNLRRLKHPNIVAFINHVFIPDASGYKHVIIQTEYLHETLLPLSDNPAGLTITRKVINQIGDALTFIHSQGIVHHDVKLENIMTTKPVNWMRDKRAIRTELRKCSFKLIDFGLARKYTCSQPMETHYRSGTMCFSSPEKQSGLPYNAFASDTFSFGLVLFQLWIGLDALERKKKDFKGKAAFWRSLSSDPAATKVPIWKQFAIAMLKPKVKMESLISKTLDPEATRPSMQQLLENFKQGK